MRDVTTLANLNETMATDPIGLLIGMSPDELPAYGIKHSDMKFESLPFALIHAALARAPWAKCVITPLMTDAFDVLDLATELSKAGYAGVLQVVVPALPRPDIIERELMQLCPDLRVELVARAPH